MCIRDRAEPEFIKPYFGLRLFPVWHVGTDYLHEIGKNWYDFLVNGGVEFLWETKVTSIDFDKNVVLYDGGWEDYDTLIFGVGKSGIDFGKQLAEEYELPTEPKPVQIGVRFEAPQKHFQKLIDVSYDFKLYRNSKTKEYHYVHSVLTTTQLMLPLKKRMEIIHTMDTLKKMNHSEMI